MSSNKVSVEQSTGQSIAARSIGERLVLMACPSLGGSSIATGAAKGEGNRVGDVQREKAERGLMP